MYQSHSCFISPESGNAQIWRYIDFVKYAQMLDKSTLYFARADKLEDPFEGSFPFSNVKDRPKLYADTPIPAHIFTQLSSHFKANRAFTAVNSWHLNNVESIAMWKLYAKNNQGIAILSTFNRLKDSLTDPNHNIYIGKITYVDWDSDYIPERNVFYPYVHKRKSFEYEQELRAVLQEIPHNEHGLDMSTPIWENGLEVQVDLNMLVENIYLSPLTPDWIVDLVKSITLKNGYKWEIKKSSLDSSPVY